MSMDEKKRSGVDRRSGEDRRQAYDLDYFLRGGTERRHWVERRWRKEMRRGWIRVSKWSSVDPRTCNPKP
jgi:hypothetical protein